MSSLPFAVNHFPSDESKVHRRLRLIISGSVQHSVCSIWLTEAVMGKVRDELHQLPSSQGAVLTTIRAQLSHLNVSDWEENCEYKKYSHFILKKPAGATSCLLFGSFLNANAAARTTKRVRLNFILARLQTKRHAVHVEAVMQQSRTNFTLISASSSSFFMFCFSVTRMPFSSRMALQRGSTLSLINTLLMQIGAILGACAPGLCSLVSETGVGCLREVMMDTGSSFPSAGFEWFSRIWDGPL